jgi:hypothetical protein
MKVALNDGILERSQSNSKIDKYITINCCLYFYRSVLFNYAPLSIYKIYRRKRQMAMCVLQIIVFNYILNITLIITVFVPEPTALRE